MESVGKGFVGEHCVFGKPFGVEGIGRHPGQMRDRGFTWGKVLGQGIITGTVLGLEVLGISCYFGHGGRRFVVSRFLRPFLAAE